MAARLLSTNFALIKSAFSPDRYPEIKKQLEQEHRYAMAVTRLVQNDINRHLYPDE